MQRLKIRGLVLWPKMLFAEPADEIPNWLFRHELEHIYQVVRFGPWKFYFLYFLYSVRYGYTGNPLEIEAQDAQQEMLTPDEAELLWKLKDDSQK